MKKTQRYFTLFEFILALALFGMVTMTASVSLAAFVQGWQRIKANQVHQEALQQITTVVASAFRNTIPFTWQDESSMSQEQVFEGEQDHVFLAYRHRLNKDQGAIRFLELKQEDNQLIAIYHHLPPLSTTEQKTEVLAENVEEVHFLYAQGYGDDLEWVSSWDTENSGTDSMSDTRKIPTAIQLKITWQNGEVTHWLRRTSGVDYTGTEY